MTLTLAEVKTHLNISDTSADAELPGFIDAAQQVVEDYIGTPLTSASASESYYGLNGPTVVLRRYPITDLTAITAATLTDAYGTLTTFTPATDLLVDGTTGLLRRTSGGYFTGTLTVTYAAGHADLPPAIRMGWLEVIRDLWQQTQRGAAALPLSGMGDDLGMSAPTPRWRLLLAPYARGSRVA